MSTVVSDFVTRLSDRGVRVLETTDDSVGELLESEIETPAVGIDPQELPVDLASLDVEIDLDPTPETMDQAATGITGTTGGIADYGSVIIQGGPEGQEPVSLYPDHHIAILRAEDIVADMGSAINDIAESIQAGNHSHIIATGPSATADMGALVEGAHGPKSVTVVVVSEE